MQNCLCVQVRLDKYFPHLFSHFAHYTVFCSGFNTNDFLQGDDQMFLKIVEEGFLSFGFFLMVLWFLFSLSLNLGNFLKHNGCRIMGQLTQFLRALLPQKLTDVIIGFGVMNVLNLFRTAVIILFFIVNKYFVVWLHLKRIFYGF